MCVCWIGFHFSYACSSIRCGSARMTMCISALDAWSPRRAWKRNWWEKPINKFPNRGFLWRVLVVAKKGFKMCSLGGPAIHLRDWPSRLPFLQFSIRNRKITGLLGSLWGSLWGTPGCSCGGPSGGLSGVPLLGFFAGIFFFVSRAIKTKLKNLKTTLK